MINNTPKITDDPVVNSMRGAFGHRATWLYLLLDEAKKAGLDEAFARKAIYRCGCLKAASNPDANLKDYVTHTVLTDLGKKIFEQERYIKDDEFDLIMHYCPLLTAWQGLTDDPEELALLCDIAMDGDRGIFSNFDFELQKSLAKGDDCCHVHVVPKKK